MSNISRFFDTRRVTGVVLATLLSLFLVALITYGATTISTNVSTGGTLDVTGATTLNAAVTLGDAVTDNITITGNATSSNTFNVAGNFKVNGYATTSGSSGNFATAGTLTVTGATELNGAVTLGDAAVDAIIITGNASTTNSLTIGKTASTTKLVVGGDDVHGTFASIIFGTCNLTATTLSASTTKNFPCTSATGVRTTDKVLVNATSTLVSGGYIEQIYIRAASSSADNNNQINVDITNSGITSGVDKAISGTLQFWAYR